MKKTLYVSLMVIFIVPVKSLAFSDEEFENARQAIQDKDGDRFSQLIMNLGHENDLNFENEDDFEKARAQQAIFFDDEYDPFYREDEPFENLQDEEIVSQDSEEPLQEESDLIPFLQKLIDSGINLNTNIKFTNENGNIVLLSPLNFLLSMSALENSFQEVKFLIEHGANVNYIDPTEGATALHWAAKNDNMSMAEYLLNNNANKNIKNFSGYLPLDLARSEDMERILKA